MSEIIKPNKLIFVGFIFLQSVIHCQVRHGKNEEISKVSTVNYSDNSEILHSYLPAQFVTSKTSSRKQVQFSRQKRQGLGLLPTEEENVPVLSVETVLGMMTNLPCNITPSVPGDQVLIVLWYKDGFGKPIYSFDLRNESPASGGRLWANEDGGNSPRAELNIRSQPTAFLSLYGVKEKDGGTYRCRVDFKKSPTRFWKVDLTVIIPPTTSVLLDEKGSEVELNVGPYNVGGTLILTCDILGGWPSSAVTWTRDGHILDSSWEEISPGKSRNTMKLEHLNREDMDSKLECRGNNNNHTQPVVANIAINMNLPPLDVLIFPSQMGSHSADTTYTFHCHSHGSQPPATLSWFDYQGTRIKAATQEVSVDGNTTISTLQYTPSINENNKPIKCRSENPNLPGSVIENYITLEVAYSPQLWLKLGPNLAEDKIKEGDDVYFACEVNSNPKTGKIIWKHNNEIIKADAKEGFLMNKGNLIIQNVQRNSAGMYSCHATNREGSGNSNVVSLIVQYAPVCVSQGQSVRVTKGEETQIVCQVEAYPTPTNFKWQFNTSTELRPIPPGSIITDNTHSVAHYTPRSEMDYGSLLCWGHNSLGLQSEPCVFAVLPAGKPDAVTNCSVSNQTYSSVIIACSKGYDGGVSQSFVLKILTVLQPDSGPGVTRDQQQETQNRLESGLHPVFKIENLQPGTQFRAVVFAKNEKGESDVTQVEFWTKTISHEIGEKLILPNTPDTGIQAIKVTPLVWIFLAIISVLVLMIVLIGLILRARCSHTNRHKAKFVRAGEQSQSMLIKDDSRCSMTRNNNPDLIPETGSVEDHSDDKSDPGVVGAIQVPGSSEWMFKRRSVCLPAAGPGQSGLGPGSHNTSFALSPSVHSRDIQQPVDHLTPGYYCTLPRNIARRHKLGEQSLGTQLSRNSSLDGSLDEIVQFSQTTTLTLPLSHSSTMGGNIKKLTCFDPQNQTQTGCYDTLPTLVPLAAPPQFADSPPDEKNSLLMKPDDNITRF